MRRALLLLVFALAACTPKRPPVVTPPTPEPEPVGVQFAELELRQAEGKLTRGGQPHVLVGAVACCMPLTVAGVERPTGWPGLSKEFIDYAIEQGGANAFHLRLGPFWVDVEPEYKDIGAAYLPDLSDWNPKFWKHQRDVVKHAGEKGANVQVSIIDTWGCKVSQRGDRYISWPAEDVHACGKTFTARHKEFTRKTVQELGCFANVIWELANESGQIEGFNPQWELDMVKAIREAEREQNCNSHMIGTNSERDEVMGSATVDYVALHKRAGIDAPWFAKWTIQNEHNPEFKPAEEHALFCSAQSVGQAWWLWRAGADEESYQRTLNLVRSGCAGFEPGTCPFDVPTPRVIQAKNHYEAPGQVNLDATPLGGDGRYCRDIGFSDGRTICPVRVEGDPFRGQCELKAMGGEIAWSVTAPLTIEPRQWGFQAVVTGPRGASGTVTCTFPAAGGENRCARPASAGGGPVVVTIP